MIRSEEYLISLLSELRKLPKETGWVEFKGNNKDPRKIGQYISALSNTAALFGKSHAYMVWGVEDETHKIVGTVFRPSEVKVGNEELENKDNSVVSRIIKDAVEAGKIKPLDPQAAPRYMKYIPFWA